MAFIYIYTGYIICGAIPLLFISPCWFPFCSPLSVPFTYLETLLDVTGSVHLVLRLLVNWPPFSHTSPNPSPLQIPSTQVTKRLTMTTSRIRLLLSGTLPPWSWTWVLSCLSAVLFDWAMYILSLTCKNLPAKFVWHFIALRNEHCAVIRKSRVLIQHEVQKRVQ